MIITVDFYYQHLDQLTKYCVEEVLVNRKDLILQHVNSRTHSAKNKRKKKEEIDGILPHAPYSTDLAPSTILSF